MDHKLTWLHLSDIHYKFNNFDTMRMRDMLIKKIGEIAKSEKFSFIVVTGDLSFQGKINVGELSTFFDSLLKAAALHKDDLFLVPGNHDVQRTSPRKAALDSFLRDLSPDFDEGMETFMLEGLSGFFAFYKEYMGKDYPAKDIHWVKTSDAYNIIGINTAITCGRDNEEGTLKIHSSKLFNALKQVENAQSINLAIGHHGLDCLNKTEANNTITQFEDYGVDLYLCGHVHQAEYTISADGNRNIPTITCGASIVDAYNTAYFIVESYDGENCIAKYYKWDKTRQQWVVDNGVSRKSDENGIIKFCLHKLSDDAIESTYLDNDAFRDFIIGFHENFELPPENETKLFTKDISEKFTNMKCNKSMVSQYNKLSLYFPIINQVMNSPSFISSKDKLIVPSVVIEAYNNNYDTYDTGHKILEAMVQQIYSNYKNKIKYSQSNLKLYIKILCYWLIYDCDIFDDIKE